MTIRFAGISDLEQIVKIYNQAISNQQTGDIKPISVSDRTEWFEEHNRRNFPVFVSESHRGINGWLSISRYRPSREAFINCGEISYYVEQTETGKGIGKRLLNYTLSYLNDKELEVLIAIILGTNIKSIEFIKSFGFEQWGRFPKIAKINGEYIDHVYMGKKLK